MAFWRGEVFVAMLAGETPMLSVDFRGCSVSYICMVWDVPSMVPWDPGGNSWDESSLVSAFRGTSWSKTAMIRHFLANASGRAVIEGDILSVRFLREGCWV